MKPDVAHRYRNVLPALLLAMLVVAALGSNEINAVLHRDRFHS